MPGKGWPVSAGAGGRKEMSKDLSQTIYRNRSFLRYRIRFFIHPESPQARAEIRSVPVEARANERRNNRASVILTMPDRVLDQLRRSGQKMEIDLSPATMKMRTAEGSKPR
jgi:hypothetical protein